MRFGRLVHAIFICLAFCSAALTHVFGSQTITLAWDPSEDSQANGYLVYSSDADGNTYGRSDVGANTSATVSSLVAGATYVFYVTAYNNEGQESESSNRVTFQVPQESQPPVVVNQSVETFENQPLPLLLSGSSATAGATLTYKVTSGPNHGTLTGATPFLTYTPEPAFVGEDSFTYVANDGSLDSAPGLVSILVKPLNHPPVADSKTIQTAEDQTVPVSLSGMDPDGDPISFSILTGPASGLLSGIAPNLNYTPNPDFHGTDYFSYQTDDGSLKSAPTTVTITVSSVNDAPVAHEKSINTPEDVPASILLSGSDPDGNSLFYEVSIPPSNGQLSGTAPNLVYTPNPNFNGDDTFTYTVSDGIASSPPVTVSLAVTPVNDSPVAFDYATQTVKNRSQTIQLVGDDADGNPLSFAVVSGPAHGQLSGTAPNLTYTPESNFLGTDSFEFVVTDGIATSAPATVVISVVSANVRVRRASLQLR